MPEREGKSLSRTSMAAEPSPSSSTSVQAESPLPYSTESSAHFFAWREFLWGALAGGFGEGMMHPIDTIKTRIQSQAILCGSQHQKNVLQMVRSVWAADGIRGFYRGVIPGVTGSVVSGATYFGFIGSTKKWIEESHPSFGGHWAHFLAGGIGDTLGSFICVPCEVMKQRMQVQGTSASWSSVISKASSGKIPEVQMYDYYTGMFQASRSIWKEQGLKGLYTGYWSTLARDMPFAGLMIMFYEALKDLTNYGMTKWVHKPDYHANSTIEGLMLGGVAGGLSAYVTTPLDVIKTRLQVQGPDLRYYCYLYAAGNSVKDFSYYLVVPCINSKKRNAGWSIFLVLDAQQFFQILMSSIRLEAIFLLCMDSYKGWFDAVRRTWMIEGLKGMFRGSVPRVIWYVPASALTFMAVEFLRENFNETLVEEEEIANVSVDKKASLPEVA